jgi:hypothetical protein
MSSVVNGHIQNSGRSVDETRGCNRNPQLEGQPLGDENVFTLTRVVDKQDNASRVLGCACLCGRIPVGEPRTKSCSSASSVRFVSFWLQTTREKNMTLQGLFRELIIISAIALFTVGGCSTYAQVTATNAPAGLQLSKDLGLADPSTEVNITVHLKLSDKAAFDQAVDALYFKTSQE